MHPAAYHPTAKRPIDTGMARGNRDRNRASAIDRRLLLHLATKGAGDSGKFVHFMFLSPHRFPSQSGESASFWLQPPAIVRH